MWLHILHQTPFTFKDILKVINFDCLIFKRVGWFFFSYEEIYKLRFDTFNVFLEKEENVAVEFKSRPPCEKKASKNLDELFKPFI